MSIPAHNDLFTGAAGLLSAHTPDSGGGYVGGAGLANLSLNGAGQLVVGASTGGTARSSTTTPGTSVTVEGTFTLTNSGDLVRLMGWYATDGSETYYSVWAGASGVYKYKTIGGANTLLQSTTLTVTQNVEHILTGIFSNGKQSIKLDGVTRGTDTTDTAIDGSLGKAIGCSIIGSIGASRINSFTVNYEVGTPVLSDTLYNRKTTASITASTPGVTPTAYLWKEGTSPIFDPTNSGTIIAGQTTASATVDQPAVGTKKWVKVRATISGVDFWSAARLVEGCVLDTLYIVVLGDSRSADDLTLNNNRAWPKIVVDMIRSIYGPRDVRLINRAIPQKTAQEFQTGQTVGNAALAAVQAFVPANFANTITIIDLGTNEIQANVSAIVGSGYFDNIIAAYTGTSGKILLRLPFWRESGGSLSFAETFNSLALTWHTMLQGKANNTNVFVSDDSMYDYFASNPSLLPDNIHEYTAGAEAYAFDVFKTMQNLGLLPGSAKGPALSDIRKDILRFDGLPGTLLVPSVNDVRYNIAFDQTLGTLRLPTVSNVILNVGYGANGTEFFGTHTEATPNYPNINDVLDGVVFGGGTGKFVPPPTNKVLLNFTYGINGNLSGTYTPPANPTVIYPPLDKVAIGIQYDLGTGTMVIPVATDVRRDVAYADTSGTLDIPDISEVEFGVVFDNGKVGTLQPTTGGGSGLTPEESAKLDQIAAVISNISTAKITISSPVSAGGDIYLIRGATYKMVFGNALRFSFARDLASVNRVELCEYNGQVIGVAEAFELDNIWYVNFEIEETVTTGLFPVARPYLIRSVFQSDGNTDYVPEKEGMLYIS